MRPQCPDVVAFRVTKQKTNGLTHVTTHVYNAWCFRSNMTPGGELVSATILQVLISRQTGQVLWLEVVLLAPRERTWFPWLSANLDHPWLLLRLLVPGVLLEDGRDRVAWDTAGEVLRPAGGEARSTQTQGDLSLTELLHK